MRLQMRRPEVKVSTPPSTKSDPFDGEPVAYIPALPPPAGPGAIPIPMPVIPEAHRNAFGHFAEEAPPKRDARDDGNHAIDAANEAASSIGRSRLKGTIAEEGSKLRNGDASTIRNGLDRARDRMRPAGQEAQGDMQRGAGYVTLATQAAANISKRFDDTANNAVNNMKGAHGSDGKISGGEKDALSRARAMLEGGAGALNDLKNHDRRGDQNDGGGLELPPLVIDPGPLVISGGGGSNEDNPLDAIGDAMGDAQDAAENAASDGADAAEDAVHDGQEAAEDGQDAAEDMWNDATNNNGGGGGGWPW